MPYFDNNENNKKVLFEDESGMNIWYNTGDVVIHGKESNRSSIVYNPKELRQ